MSELRQEHRLDRTTVQGKEKLLAVRISPTEVRYLTPQELEQSITQEDVQCGLDLAGAWGNLNMSEEDMFKALQEIRYGSEPTALIKPE